MINVTSQILKFRDFLVHSWPDLDRLMENHDWDEDGAFMLNWLQVNWEFLVKRELLKKNGFLKTYTYSDHRITNPHAVATHEIICRVKSDSLFVDDRTGLMIPKGTKITFGGFIAKLCPGYGCYPPFDYVTIFTAEKKHMYKLALKDVDFFLSPI